MTTITLTAHKVSFDGTDAEIQLLDLSEIANALTKEQRDYVVEQFKLKDIEEGFGDE